jgi:hypothetical protein
VASRRTVYSVLLLLLSSGLGGFLIKGPVFGQALSVTLTSPTPGASFATGQTVTINAVVSDGGSPVSGATVNANSPTGTTIALTETLTHGTYSVAYGLASTVPTGTWTITVVASSNGMLASAQVAVFIVSGSLTVTFLTPAPGALFNVGETATIRATVTHPDGTAIPPSSSVTFAKPNGLTAAMIADPTDPTGRTWLSSYTVMSTDALLQGFDWPITITATAGTSTGTAVQHVNLFNSLQAAVLTFSDSAYTVLQNTFTAGQTVFVKSAVTLHDGTQVTSGSTTFEISGTSVAASPVGMTYSPSLAAWTGAYLILPTDQVGAQFVAVSATDTQGNTGSGVHVISLATGSTQGLSVFITAPSANTVFNRGETATIAALVTLNGAPVSGASLVANAPTGATIVLVNTAGGMYSGQYTVLSTDPIGAWTATVSAMLNGQTATSQVALMISNSLNVAVSTYANNAYTAPQDTFVAGQTVFVKAVAALHDGIQVSLGGASFVISGTSVASTPVPMTYSPSVGAWTGSYVVLPTDTTGSQAVTASAFDTHGNAGSGNHMVALTTASSQSLAIFINAPISNTVFNHGEAVSITALVTINGVPVSGATVTANSPAGALIVLANTAGGAYTGQYTVLSTDPIGTWTLVLHATSNGQAAMAQESLSISNSLNVSVATFSSSTYTTPQDAFVAGQSVFVKATVTLHDSTLVSSGGASFEITGTSVASSPVVMTYSPSLNAWTGSYLALSTDQTGTQTVTASAFDTQGNSGSGVHTITLTTASSQGLSVFINTPVSHTVFNRGEMASLTALVTLNGAPVSGAAVTATTPTGAIIALANTAGGAYASQYTVSTTDPVGAWNLVVQAAFNGLSTSTQEPLTISSSLKVSVATYSSSSYSTPQSSFNTGQAVFVKAQIMLQDGTAVTSGTATFVITGTSIATTPMTLVYSSSLSAWTGSYTVLQSDQVGSQTLTTTATDFTGNAGSGSTTVMIGITTNAPTPLEAGITFNPTTRDIQVNAICGAGCVAPTTVTQTSSGLASASQNDDGHGDGDGHGHGQDHGQQGDGNGGYVNRTYTISDSGGHVVTLVIRVQAHENEVKASVLSVQYGNASPTTPTDSRLDFRYSLADNGGISTLEESVGGGNATGHAHYDAKDGMTTIIIGSAGDGGEGGDDEGGSDDGQNTITNSGLWLLELTTSDGTLGLSYFQSA